MYPNYRFFICISHPSLYTHLIITWVYQYVRGLINIFLSSMAANDTDMHHVFKQELHNLAQVVENRQKLQTPEAIGRIVNGKASVNNIKKSIFMVNKSPGDLEDIRWFDSRRQQQIVSICQQACNLTQEQRQQSMRSTQKNLSEMNDEILKMRKSLTDKGILDERPEPQYQENQPKIEQHQIAQKINKQTADEQMKQSKQDQKNEEQQNAQLLQQKSVQIQQKENTEQKKEASKQNVEKNDQQQGQKSLYQRKQVETQMKEEQQKQQKIENHEQEKSQQHNNQKQVQKYDQDESETIKSPSKVYMNSKGMGRSRKMIDTIEERQGEESTIIQNKSKMNNFQQPHHDDKVKQDQNQSQNMDHPSIQEQKIKNNYQKDQQMHPNQSNYQMEANTNQFFDQTHKNSAQLDKSRIFRPKLSKNQRLISLYPANFFNHLPTEQQKMYAKISYKLTKLFQHYIKELKPTALTFDTIPKSLDLTTAIKYSKQFELNKLMKSGDLSKLFKKLAVNGLWLQQSGFIKMNKLILQIPKTIQQDLQFCEIFAEKRNRIQRKKKQKMQRQEEQRIQRQQRRRIAEYNGEEVDDQVPQSQKEEDQKIDEEDQKKYDRIFNILSKINDSYLPDQRVAKKLNIRFNSPKTIKHQFDVDKLKNIIKSHTGTSKELVKKMNQQKKQQQIRHQMQVQRILQRYKNQQVPQYPSSQTKSTKSLRILNHQKMDSYAHRNRMKKGGSASSTVKVAENSHLRLKSQGKMKPYFMERNQNDQSEILTQVSQAPTNKNKKVRSPIQNRVEVYRQLSLPKLPKRVLRDQSIYQSLMKIDVKPEIQSIKHLVENEEIKQQDEVFKNFYAQERKKVVKEKEKRKKSPVQQRMKFT